MTRAQRGIIGNRDGEDQVGDVVAQHGHDGQGQDDQGKAQEDVHAALQIEVDAPAEVGAPHTEDGPCRRSEQGRAEAHDERRARAVDQPRQHVAAEGVGAQPVGALGRASIAPKSTASGS